jgi:phosphate acyltransferase
MRESAMLAPRDGPQRIPIAVDAMGGDHAPDEIVAGAVLAAQDGISVLLTGRPGLLRPLLAKHGVLRDIQIVPAEDAI